MTQLQPIFIGSSTAVQVNDLEWYDTSHEDAAVSDATITASVLTEAGNVVSGSSISLSLTDAVRGNYEGVIPSTISLTENSTYFIQVVITLSNGFVDTRRIRCKAVYRGAS